MPNELATTRQLTPDTWQMISAIAPTMHQARLFGVSSPDQAAAIMLKGYELGLGLTASFEFVHVIQGKPTLSPRGALALIMQHPECAGIEIVDGDDECTVTMKRKNGFEYTTTFTMDDAKRAGLVKPDGGWAKYPSNMLRWRAVGYCADVVFPDVIGGMKRADEFGAPITPEGDVIEGQWETVPSTTVTVDLTPNLQEFMDEHGAEAVLSAITKTNADPQTPEGMAALEQWFETGRFEWDKEHGVGPEEEDEAD